MMCLHCGGENIEYLEMESSTGVSSPDGYPERVIENGYLCLDCGASGPDITEAVVSG